MILGGTIELQGPSLEDSEQVFYNKKEAMEFILKTKKADKEDIKHFTVWASLDRDEKIKIKTNFNDDDEYNAAYLYVEMEDSRERTFSLTISPEQARALKGILERFIEIYYASRALKTVYEVKSA